MAWAKKIGEGDFLVSELGSKRMCPAVLRLLPKGSVLSIRAKDKGKKGGGKGARKGALAVRYGVPGHDKSGAAGAVKWFDTAKEALKHGLSGKQIFNASSAFYLSPSIGAVTHALLSEVIEAHGGNVAEDFDASSPIFAAASELAGLVATFGIHKSKAVSLDFFFDSCRQGRALDLAAYALGAERLQSRRSPRRGGGGGGGGGGSGSGGAATAGAAGAAAAEAAAAAGASDPSTYARRPYTDAEDQALLHALFSLGLLLSAKLAGNKAWIKLERTKVPGLAGRSWQSLRERYAKKLRGSVSWKPTRARMLGWGLDPSEGWEAVHKVGRGKGSAGSLVFWHGKERFDSLGAAQRRASGGGAAGVGGGEGEEGEGEEEEEEEEEDQGKKEEEEEQEEEEEEEQLGVEEHDEAKGKREQGNVDKNLADREVDEQDPNVADLSDDELVAAAVRAAAAELGAEASDVRSTLLVTRAAPLLQARGDERKLLRLLSRAMKREGVERGARARTRGRKRKR